LFIGFPQSYIQSPQTSPSRLESDATKRIRLNHLNPAAKEKLPEILTDVRLVHPAELGSAMDASEDLAMPPFSNRHRMVSHGGSPKSPQVSILKLSNFG
jgi:hypothetical protein